MRPNLFKYATSELSQDAMICWLLEWAKPEYKDVDANMHNAGVNFLDSLFAKFDSIQKPVNYQKILIKRQYKNIDVLCIVNEEFSIIIEDKTNTKNHSTQLERYLETSQKDFPDTQLMPLYVKTYDQSSYSDVYVKKYKPYLRKDLLDVLGTIQHNNDILDDFHKHLKIIEDRVSSYQTKPLDEWVWDSFKGFYIELKNKLGEGEWDYVANPSGGFLGFWWGFEGTEECKQYMQIESKYNKNTKLFDSQLCIKIKVQDKEKRKQYRKECFTRLLQKSTEFNKPNRFGSGMYMTIGILNADFRKTNDREVLDIEETVKNLKNLQSMIVGQ